MIKIVIGLVSVMVANVLLGVTLAKLKKEFNKEKFNKIPRYNHRCITYVSCRLFKLRYYDSEYKQCRS